MAKSNPFKVGDKVFVYPFGWGTVELGGTDNDVRVLQECRLTVYPCSVASFTEYDPIKGGLSHERPEEKKRPTIDASKFYETNEVDRDMLREFGLQFIARIEAKDLISKLERNRQDDPNRDIIPAETAERNLKALKYIKKLLKDDYNVVDDLISVEELGDEVQVSLTFRKG